MLAHAFLAIATAIERDHAPTLDQMIELAVNEFRRLFDGLLLDRERRPSVGSPGLCIGSVFREIC